MHLPLLLLLGGPRVRAQSSAVGQLTPAEAAAAAAAAAMAAWPSTFHDEGLCRSEGCDKGSYDEEWGIEQYECQAMCAQNAECTAFEYVKLGSTKAGGPDAYSRCELHKTPVVGVFPGVGVAVCRLKPAPRSARPMAVRRFHYSKCGAGLVGLPASPPYPPSVPPLPPIGPGQGLWVSPGGAQGACRSHYCKMPPSHPVQCRGCLPGCNASTAALCKDVEDACSLGAYSGFATATETECRALCQADETCTAYEWSELPVGSGKRCELHYAEVSYTKHHYSSFKCFLKPAETTGLAHIKP